MHLIANNSSLFACIWQNALNFISSIQYRNHISDLKATVIECIFLICMLFLKIDLFNFLQKVGFDSSLHGNCAVFS